MEKKRSYRWYVYPRDEHTNKVLSMNTGFEFIGEAVCKDKSTRQLWQGSSEAIDGLKLSKRSLGLNFLLFVQEGNGAIRPANFRLKTRRNKNAVVRSTVSGRKPQ